MDQVLFWTAAAAIGQIAGAIATAAAVIVSLWIALSERSTMLDVSCGLRMIIPGDGTPATDIVAIRIANSGYRKISIATIGWRTGWTSSSLAPEWLKRQFAVQLMSIGSPRAPFDLEPMQSVTAYITAADFLNPALAQRNEEFFCRKNPFTGRIRATKIECLISPNVGRDKAVRAEKSLVAFLATGIIENGAEKFNAAAGVH